MNEKNIITKPIDLVHGWETSGSNYYSLIIGNNGTGKSRILSNIARFFIDKNKRRNNNNSFFYDTEPQKVIAITNGISDKFPVDESYRPLNYEIKKKYNEFYYNYIGARSRTNAFTNRTLINRAIDILLENYSERDISNNYRHVFDYLDYEPILKLKFKLSQRFSLSNSKYITPNDLYSYIEKNQNNRGFMSTNFERYYSYARPRADEICDFINKNYNSYDENELIINFSKKNIDRMRLGINIEFSIQNQYELMDLMRKLDLIRGMDTFVYKKGGSEFGFSDASSGEANILSTLLALIPLLRDNSLILIDEPEISLHPLWQMKYIDLLQKIMENFSGCHIIIASHSHFIVTDLPIGQSTVITLKEKKGIIESRLVQDTTFGWSAEDVLLNVFELPTSRNYFLSELLTEALELISLKKGNSKRVQDVKVQLRKLRPIMKETDPLTSVVDVILTET